MGSAATPSPFILCFSSAFGVGGLGGIRLYPALKVTYVVPVVMGFSRTNDGHNHWQGASFVHAHLFPLFFSRSPVCGISRCLAQTCAPILWHPSPRSWQVGGLRLGLCPCGALICVKCQAIQSAEDGSHVCQSVAEAAEVDPETEKLLKKIGKK